MPTQTLKYNETTNYIAGKPDANGQQRMDVRSPLDGSLISTVLLSTANDLDKAVKAAEAAFRALPLNSHWSRRAQIIYMGILEVTRGQDIVENYHCEMAVAAES